MERTEDAMTTASRLEARIEDRDTAIRNRQRSNYLYIKIISQFGIVYSTE
jgi:hypothetical protein